MQYTNARLVWSCLLPVVASLTCLGSARVIIISPAGQAAQHLKIIEGEEINLGCRSSRGHPLTWSVQNVRLHPGDKYLIQNISQPTTAGSSSQLTILDTRLSDSGLYTCRSFRNETDLAQINITVQRHTSIVDTSDLYVRLDGVAHNRQLSIDSGRPLTLKCYGHSRAQLRWYHNDIRLTPSSQVVITISGDIINDRQVSLLSKNSARPRDAGTYECRDLIPGGNRDNVTVRIRERSSKKVPVEIIQPVSEREQVPVDESFEIKCKTDFNSRVKWMFDETQELHDRIEGVSIVNVLDRDARIMMSVLRLEGAKVENSGKYTCQNLKESGDKDSVEIEVGDGKSGSSSTDFNKSQSVIPTSVVMRVGTMVTLQCSFQSHGNYSPEWTKDGQILVTGDKYIINQHSVPSTLVIRNANRDDAGVYKCQFKTASLQAITGVVIFNVSTLECPPLPILLNGYPDRCSRIPAFGESCRFRCNPGYSLVNNTPLVCERDNEKTFWSGDFPKCSELPSKSTEIPMTVSYVLARINSGLRMHCSGQTTWRRLDEDLNDEVKYSVDEHSLTIKNMEKSDVGTYECRVFHGDVMIERHTFNVQTLPCPALSKLSEDVILEGCHDAPVYGEVCIFSCPNGYTLAGSRLRSCELSGSNNEPYWTGEPPACLGTALSWTHSNASSANIPANTSIKVKATLLALTSLLYLTSSSRTVLS